MPELAWYWWALIAVVVVVGGYAKLTLFKKMMTKKEAPMEDDME